jgi:hypothetical protein
MELKFRRVITGFRCHETDCFEQGVWYIETDSEFFHWCPKHAITYMGDRQFWVQRLPGQAPIAAAPEKPTKSLRNRRRRSKSGSEDLV